LPACTNLSASSIAQQLALTRPVPPLPGVDLSRLIQGKTHEIIEPDGSRREARAVHHR
jgi:hypothetical protein